MKAQAQVTRAIFCPPGTTFWMEVEAHVTRAILYGNLQEKCRTRIPGAAFCVEIYRKKRTWTCDKSHFVWKFTGKMPPAQVPTSIKHRAFYPYRKNPFSVATLFGEILFPSTMSTSSDLENGRQEDVSPLPSHEGLSRRKRAQCSLRLPGY